MFSGVDWEITLCSGQSKRYFSLVSVAISHGELKLPMEISWILSGWELCVQISRPHYIMNFRVVTELRTSHPKLTAHILF